MQGNVPVVLYISLEHRGIEVPLEIIHNVVKFNGELYVYKDARFPGTSTVCILAQELRNYQLLKNSRWIAELGGVVSRRGHREALLIRYYPKGNLSKHFNADDMIKQQWVVQIATALAEFDAVGFVHYDLKCAQYCG